MDKNRRLLLWVILVSMSAVLLAQILAGFDRLPEIILGCLGAVMALGAAGMLLMRRRS